MVALPQASERRTSADVVFEDLYEQIVSLDLLPGTKMSEVEIAKRFGVSRQPVRDAFSRLGNLGLLVIRPQKATVVRHFSLEGIQNARFIRTAVEVEVLRRACRSWDTAFDARIDDNLEAQRAAIAAKDTEAFHQIDYEFHRLLCEAAGASFAFETIAANKAQVDRLCILSLNAAESMETLLQDHIDIMDGLRAGDAAAVDGAIRRHLERLDPTIETIHATHSDYFQD
ncbi:GntR family transcriptional regulator [Jannaschia marina]|uniref:GntR family transcriptional regulator n=1 Tax=Jannaschia marina TaxID=2741674 RepID=UPI0015C7AD70|nr:GntR family transcriptional regulator [Jannaschia marina]